MKVLLHSEVQKSNSHYYKLIALILAALMSLSAFAQTFPAGFSQVKVGTIYYPTSMAFAPDGRIFVTEKAGKVKIVKNGTVLGTPFYSVSVDQLNERGLSSIAIDPNFNTNHYVYIFYTTSGSNIHNRLSRVTANGDVALAGSEVTLLDMEPLQNSIHNGGGMAFGPDGKLYLAVGNDNVNSFSQDLSNYKGKVLRINPDGSVPSGNPFSGSASASRIWAYGLRNPWSIDIQPGTGKIFVNDVGEGAWEEINNATTAGKNFGWPGAEGNSSNPAYTNPVYAYHHGASGTDYGCAITGGAFFNPSGTNYPSTYTGKYFFIDYCNNWINYIDPNTGQKSNFATNLGGALNYLKVGNDGNLYYYSISANSLYKIIHSNNNAPTITMQPSNVTVSQGQNATFTVAASGATPLSYQWKKNGVNISGANSASYTITNVQSSNAGQYSVYVSNAYGNVTSNNATLTVTAFNGAPTATITAPTSGALYSGGSVINFSGNGTDPEDGALPASSSNWYVEFHHDAHIHPGPYIAPGINSGSFNISTTGEASANVYYRLFLYVTDAQGLKDTSFVDIHPRTSTITLASQPSGLQLNLDGQPHTTPYSVLAVQGMSRAISAPSPLTLNGTNYNFSHWAHGGAATQNITVATTNQTYTAVYTAGGASTGCSATGTITREVWNNVLNKTLADIPFNSTPSSTGQLTIFEAPANVADNYGSRIRGYICPPATGNYVFWISSDNNSELWLSTSSNPASKVKIAFVEGYTMGREWTKYPGQQSQPIALTAGTKYYIEAIHREGNQGDHLEVGWKLPNGTLERPIPGSRLSPFSASSGAAPVVSITSPANNSTYPNPANITINANASTSSGSIVKVEFYEGTNKIGEDLSSPYTYTWMNVTTGAYQLKAVAVSSSGQTGTSSVVNVNVTDCSTPIVTAAGPTTMCSGSVLLKTTYISGNLYQWKKDGVNISGATNYTYTASSSGEYQVKVIQGSCISWSAPTRVTIENGLRATITPGGPTQFCPGQSVKLYANTCTNYTYQWKKDGTDITGATASVYTATTSGSYQVKVTQAGVNAWSSLVNVNVTCREGEDPDSTETLRELAVLEPLPVPSDPEVDFKMKVFPNPNSGLFTIELNMPSIIDEKVTMRIVNMLGQQVFIKEIANKSDYLKETVELDNTLQTGVYTLQVVMGTKVENTSVVLSR
ncbi:MAG: carbohydrate-binding protein [Bacteroidota bacterium]|jgi:glucose/arabinose dehydrogenase|nr:carbohydrate-binding protein [Bacteroidota bacterium]